MKKKAKIVVPNEPPRFHVRINTDHHSHVTREADRDNQWDGDDISHDYSINGFEVVENCWDFILHEDPTGKDYYLVYVLYDTGDSFHREENCMCLVSFLPDLEDAKAILDAIEKDHRDYKKTQTHEYKPIDVHLPKANRIEQVSTGTWTGYFEHIRSVNIQPLRCGSMSVKFD